jgi:hypothetical protein
MYQQPPPVAHARQQNVGGSAHHRVEITLTRGHAALPTAPVIERARSQNSTGGGRPGHEAVTNCAPADSGPATTQALERQDMDGWRLY